MNKEELYLAEDNLAAEIEEISEFVFNHAELGSEEFKSCKYLVEKLKEHGFTVTCPYLDLDTAFRAELYCGGSESCCASGVRCASGIWSEQGRGGPRVRT